MRGDLRVSITDSHSIFIEMSRVLGYLRHFNFINNSGPLDWVQIKFLEKFQSHYKYIFYNSSRYRWKCCVTLRIHQN
jgi:hypothetical protein